MLQNTVSFCRKRNIADKRSGRHGEVQNVRNSILAFLHWAGFYRKFEYTLLYAFYKGSRNMAHRTMLTAFGAFRSSWASKVIKQL